MSEIIPSSRYQQELFSSLDDQVEAEAIVRIIDKVVDVVSKESSSLKEKQNDVGRPEYPKRELLKLYLYGYMNRVKSSRKLERECKVNIEVMWLMGKLQPDHWTISRVRKENTEEIKGIIKSFNKFLIGSGYLEGKTIVIDGTKLKANASSSGNMNIGEITERLEDIENKMVYYLEAFNQNDELEEEKEKISELRKEREELQRQIEQLKSQNKKVYVKTDPDSNIIRTKEGTKAAYNAQVSCDSKHKLIIVTDVSSQSNDFNQFDNMYEKSKEMLLGKKPEEIVADAGYYSPETIQKIEEEDQIKTFVAELPEQTKGDFKYDKQKDEYICTQGKRLRFEKEKLNSRGRNTRIYRCNEGSGCSIKKECTRSTKGRIKIRYINQDFRDSYREKMKEEQSRKKIRLRKTIVEHPIGTIKLWLGKNPLLLRGIEKVRTEIRLVSLSYNLLRIYNIDGFDGLMQKLDKYNFKLA
jgi:transposase